MESMDEALGTPVSQADLEKFEKQYHKELAEQAVTNKSQFDYAMCLVRSQYSSDIKKGVILLEDLVIKHAEGNRDYIYYLAIGNGRLKNYSIALKYLQAFLQVEPNNSQVLSLEQHFKKKMEREGMIGFAVASGAALVLGGIVGIGMAMARSK